MTIESEEFYNICQNYRHAKDFGPAGIAYELLINYIEDYAKQAVEEYKTSLVPVAWMIKYENGEWGPSQTKSLEYESIPLYALPLGKTK